MNVHILGSLSACEDLGMANMVAFQQQYFNLNNYKDYSFLVSELLS